MFVVRDWKAVWEACVRISQKKRLFTRRRKSEEEPYKRHKTPGITSDHLRLSFFSSPFLWQLRGRERRRHWYSSGGTTCPLSYWCSHNDSGNKRHSDSKDTVPFPLHTHKLLSVRLHDRETIFLRQKDLMVKQPLSSARRQANKRVDGKRRGQEWKNTVAATVRDNGICVMGLMWSLVTDWPTLIQSVLLMMCCCHSLAINYWVHERWRCTSGQEKA